MGKYLDMSNVWFGYDKVNPELLSKVLYKGDQIGNVWLPTTKDGDIDWQSLHSFAQAEEYIKSRNIVTPQEKNKVHA
jgi:hypothetical protein